MGRLADAAAARVAAQRRPMCTVGLLVSSLDDEDRADLAGLMASDAQHTVICDALRDALGATIAPQTLGRHRNGRCGCGSAS